MSSEALARLRLFVGLAVPAAIAQRLADLQPQPGPGIRLVLPANMHVTLHFLGQADPEAVSAALLEVDARPFSLAITGTGSFRLRTGGRIVWAGVDVPAALEALHAATARALATIGFEPEPRPFRPHITLARLKPQADAALATTNTGPRRAAPASGGGAAGRAGARATGAGEIGRFAVDAFVLYRSDSGDEGPRYSAVERFPLR